MAGDFRCRNPRNLNDPAAVTMDGLKYGKLVSVGLLLAMLVGCGGIGPFTQGMPDFTDAIPEIEPPPFRKNAAVPAFEGDQWSPRQDWSVWQGAKGTEAGADPELFSRWKHPAIRLIRDEMTRSKLQRSMRTTSEPAKDSIPTDSREATSGEPLFNWRELMAREDLDGWNGIILYARYHPLEAAEYLPELVELAEQSREYRIVEKTADGEKTKTSLTSNNLRAAAAEGCGFVLQAGGGKSPERHLEVVLDLAERTDLPDEVRMELFRGLGRIIPPRDIPRLSDVLRPRSTYTQEDPAPTDEMRLAALDACLYHAVLHPTSADPAQEDWPPNLLNLRNDPDSRLRIKIGQLAAITKHSAAPQLLNDQLTDAEPNVRMETLVSLGRLGSTAAREELRIQGKKNEDLMRVSAIRGLSFFGPEELHQFADDSSPYVRQEMATQLSQFQDYGSAIQLRKLLVDPNLQVQMEVVKATVHWPDRPAVGLLIFALQESSARTRQAALSALETRYGSPLLFPVHGSKEERLRASENLARLWPGQIDFDMVEREGRRDGNAETDKLRVEDLKQDLRNLATLDPQDPRGVAIQRRLMDLGPSDIGWLEQYVFEGPQSQQRWILDDVLPKLSRMHQALAEMERPDVTVRRRGAERLASESNLRPLGNLELQRLEQVLAREQDAIVWKFAMVALEKDVSAQGARIAQMAVNHTWPDIRILGCRQICRLGGQEQALWLLPLFSDTNVLVQVASVEAAMRCGNPIVLDGIPGQGGGVRSLITTEHPQLRVQVCACLCQFGDQQGVNELTRLARDGNWNIRYAAVEAMGSSGQTRFVGTLTQLGWTEKHPSVQRVLLQSLEQLVPASQRPPELRGNLTPQQQLEMWVAWWNKREGAVTLQTVEGIP